MKVKVGNDIFDSEDLPIMLILSTQEKMLVKEMREEDHRLCIFPQYIAVEDVEKFMEGEY